MSPEIIVDRNNCDNGFWELPDGSETNAWGILEYYIENETGLSPQGFRSCGFDFEPHNPEDAGKHNVPGLLTIRYEI